MRVQQNTDGSWLIDNDSDVVIMANGVNLATVDVSKYRLDLGVLSQLYLDAQGRKTKEDAAKYVKMKQRILDFFTRRDKYGERYE